MKDHKGLLTIDGG